MRKGRRLLAFVLVLAMALTGLPGSARIVHAEEITLESISMEVGETHFIGGYEYNVRSCSTSDDSVATVKVAEYADGGDANMGKLMIAAVGEGSAAITFSTYSGDNYTINVTISGDDSGDIPVESISVTPTEAEVEIGQTVALTAEVLPENAGNKSVTWSSDDEQVAVVENGVVTGVSEGTANITATTEDGQKTASAVVTVKKAADPVAVTGIFLDPTELSIEVGAAGKLTAVVEPCDSP